MASRDELLRRLKVLCLFPTLTIEKRHDPARELRQGLDGAGEEVHRESTLFAPHKADWFTRDWDDMTIGERVAAVIAACFLAVAFMLAAVGAVPLGRR